MSKDKTEKEKGIPEFDFLTPEEVKRYLKVITHEHHAIVMRLLINGVPIKHLRKIRGKDVKHHQNALKLRKPRRKIFIDPVTINLIISHMSRNQIGTKSTDKIIQIKLRNIRHYARYYGELSGVGDVSTQTLFNTYFSLNLMKNPEMTPEDYHKHLGYSDIEYTKRLLRRFKKEVKMKTSMEKMSELSSEIKQRISD